MTAYLIPSNTNYFYEIICQELPNGLCSLTPAKKNCTGEEFPINWIGSEYVAEVPTVLKELQSPACYKEDTLFEPQAMEAMGFRTKGR